MKIFLKNYYEKILVLMAVLIFAGLLFCFIWGGRVLIIGLERVVGSPDIGEDKVKFDIEGAAKLNLELIQ